MKKTHDTLPLEGYLGGKLHDLTLDLVKIWEALEQNCFGNNGVDASYLRFFTRPKGSGILLLDSRTSQVMGGILSKRIGVNILNIERVLVSPDYRKLGIGSLLITECMRRYLTGKRIQAQAWVDENNLPVQKLYSSMGFRAVTLHRSDEEMLFMFNRDGAYPDFEVL